MRFWNKISLKIKIRKSKKNTIDNGLMKNDKQRSTKHIQKTKDRAI